jgi:hypothetical protein
VALPACGWKDWLDILGEGHRPVGGVGGRRANQDCR